MPVTLTQEQFEHLTAELKKAVEFQTSAWADVIRNAREVAQLNAFGTYTDPTGTPVHPHSSSLESVKKYADQRLQESIMRAFFEDANVGVQLQQHLVNKS